MPNDSQLEALKLPPHSPEAEQSVLGGLLLENGAADRIGEQASDVAVKSIDTARRDEFGTVAE